MSSGIEVKNVSFRLAAMTEKTFRQGRRDGNGKWKWGTKGIRRVLYKLPEIKSEEDLFYVEGEKDVEGIFSLGLCATTNPGGAGKLAKLQAEHRILNPLKGKSVFILPDNDEAGRKHAEQAAELLYKIAKEARIVPLPGLSDKGDVSDFIEKEGDKARGKLIELAVSAPVWKPPSNFLSAEDLLTTKYEHKTPIIARGIMPDNSHIIVSGETGVGKSLLRQELALHLAMGWEWLDFEIPTARKVAVFQYENSDQMEQTRLKRMCHGLGIERLPKGIIPLAMIGVLCSYFVVSRSSADKKFEGGFQTGAETASSISLPLALSPSFSMKSETSPLSDNPGRGTMRASLAIL